MPGDLHKWGKSDISLEILAYLAEHPDSYGTFETILEWWLLERKIQFQSKLVKEALDELVAQGFVQNRKGYQDRNQYQINRQKLNEVRTLINQEKGRGTSPADTEGMYE